MTARPVLDRSRAPRGACTATDTGCSACRESPRWNAAAVSGHVASARPLFALANLHRGHADRRDRRRSPRSVRPKRFASAPAYLKVIVAGSSALALLLSSAAAWSADAEGRKAIYAADDRIEVVAADQAIQDAAASVVALFSADALSRREGDDWQLPTKPTGRDSGWCEDEPYAEQTTTAVCSGFLIAPNRVATSAHCVQPVNDDFAPGLPCAQVRVVFGYRVEPNGVLDPRLAKDQVYGCSAVVGGDSIPGGRDWRVIALDRAVLGHAPLMVLDVRALDAGQPVEVVGHPSGLPAKVGRNGKVLRSERNGYFVTDLDTYEGSSGSPVFTKIKDTLVVAGLLSRGVRDFDPASAKENCRRSRRCKAGECEGEQVTFATYLKAYASKVLHP